MQGVVVMSRYRALGVDIKKKGVEAFRDVVDNLFPGAFCVVQRDPDDPGMGLVSHVDGAGSKPISTGGRRGTPTGSKGWRRMWWR